MKKINKIDRLLARLMSEREGGRLKLLESEIKGDTSTDLKEIKKKGIIREYNGQLYANKLDNRWNEKSPRKIQTTEIDLKKWIEL